MNRHTVPHGLVRALVAAGLAAFVCTRAVHAQDAPDPDSHARLEARTAAFTEHVRTGGFEDLRDYFSPDSGFLYRTTTHQDTGAVVGVWVVPGPDVQRALARPRDIVVQLYVEGQLVGAFPHQVLHRQGRWRYVGENRFVPPGAPASSPSYVKWRRQGSRWVIAVIADERFMIDELPSWCCE